jgi:glycosyltransferase involved in cell wall biosynthesis
MKKRILIIAHYMHIGGAEISLVGLLGALDYAKYDVDLFIYSHEGDLMKFIPKEVNLLPEIPQYAQLENPIKDVVKHGYFAQAFARLRAKWKYRSFVKKHHPDTPDAYFQYLDNEITPTLSSLKQFGTYDLAINFIGMMNITIDKVDAKKKMAWIHTDLSRVSNDVELSLKAWQQFDYIGSISAKVTETFLKVYPSLSDKIIEIENILSPDFVRNRAEEFNISPEFDAEVNLLSIGRYTGQKNFDSVPIICRYIVEKYPALKWYIIGFGEDEMLIQRKIAEAKMEDHVILLGKRTNPYPYIKACDIYVQPSRYEGKSVTVREAQMLCKPVVITNYATATSQVKDGIDGVIVPMDNAGCAQGIIDFIADKGKQARIASNLKTLDFGNVAEVEKIYKLI